MKKVLGLDLGSASIGWAFVEESEKPTEVSRILGAGVRVVPLSSDEIKEFSAGQGISTNAARTLKRGARRNLQRYKLRREWLLRLLKSNGIIDVDKPIAEEGSNSTHEMWELRSKAATEKLNLHDFARVLLMLNKKRGYKSSRKSKGAEDDGTSIDAVGLSLQLRDRNITPGFYLHEQSQKIEKFLPPSFYPSDLKQEIISILKYQQQFHSTLITNDFIELVTTADSRRDLLSIFQKKYNIELAETPKNRSERKQIYWKCRYEGISQEINLNVLAYVICEIQGEIDNSSGYLGAISDRSKELRVNRQTVGQATFEKIKADKQFSTKNIIFYRQDYLNEFETIWDCQAQFHPKLTEELRQQVRDAVIFYQRRLKSQKHLVSDCEFASQIKIKSPQGEISMKKKVAPKSSPFYQEYRLLQFLNNLNLRQDKVDDILKIGDGPDEGSDHRSRIYKWLQLKDKLSANELKKIIGLKSQDDNSEFELNFTEIIGNRTRAAFIQTLNKIFELTGHEAVDLNIKKNPDDIENDLRILCEGIGIPKELLEFNPESKDAENHIYYRVWHLLYSAEEDEHIKEELTALLNLQPEMLPFFYNLKLEADFGSVSAWAIKQLLPYMKGGMDIAEACAAHSESNPKRAFKHSQSETTEERENRELLDVLPLFSKGSLRNPVVEKVMNQLVHVVNQIIQSPQFGRPDEIRIEMGRDLKASNEERDKLSKVINSNKKRNDDIRKRLLDEFGPQLGNRITAKDILKYKLWQENKISLYSGKQINLQDVFGRNSFFDIEHIIPKSRIFDDSFSNKTLCERKINEIKGNDTAYTYFEKQGEEELEKFKARVNFAFNQGKADPNTGISYKKFKILMTPNDKIPDDFISRQLQETRYINRKATSHLAQVCKFITPTTGIITQKLRDDWGLIDLLKELNWPKYSKIVGKTYYQTGKNGERLSKIKDWSKRDDHRHHAMDAITVAFTKRSLVQYLSTLNAKNKSHYDKDQQFSKLIEAGKFVAPMHNIREEARYHLEALLVSQKAKNKVTTTNINRIKRKGRESIKIAQETPRGQLHKETVYAQQWCYGTKEIKLSANTTIDEINSISNQKIREAVLERFNLYQQDAKLAFTGKNALKKQPIWMDSEQRYAVPDKIKTTQKEEIFTIRKSVDPDLKMDKVVDEGVRRVLQKRLDAHGGNAKAAFTNLEKDPIWFDEANTIQIKKVKITGVSNAEPLHFKKDHFGNYILDDKGMRIPNDFVSLGNNHHIAIYQDLEGNYQEQVVSLYEAVKRKSNGEPIVQKNHPMGWRFIFSLKQNEMFVFPADGFDPKGMDLCDPKHRAVISPNLYRVQKITIKDYFFRHHLETSVTNDVKDVSFKRVTTLKSLTEVSKVRVNHLGMIVQSNIQE